ncbi:MAG: BatD family protein, partial [Candidatus Symbiothrix sp.]|nr:BatD family protein [Candidatus Symbiothrix sp.]
MKRKLLFLLIFAAIAGNGFAQISFKGTAPRAVVAGQQFRVIYTLTYSEERGKDILIPETNGIQVLFGPTVSTSMMTNIVNGNRTTTNTLSHTYVMMAEKEGEYTLSPASIKVGNSEYKSNELKIIVLPPDQEVTAANTNAQAAQQESGSQAKASNGEIFIRMIVSKSSVYENEGFLVSFKLYTTVDVTGFENLKFPEFEGFVAQEIELPENKQLQLENYQGRNYRSVVLKQSILYPQRAGKINIGQGKYEAVVREVAQQQRSRSFFDDFFAPAYTNVKKTLTSQAVSIDVKPLPGNQPAAFSGAVGDYKLSSTISATSLKANEPVTIKLTLSGTGNIKMLKNPEIVFPNDFEIYDPKIDVNTKVSANGVSGTKTIEYYAVPRYAGNFTIPSIQFSYFDLNSGSYKTLSTNTYQLQVAPGEGGSGENATIVTGINKEDVRFVGADIRHIKTGHFNFQKGDFFFGTFEYWLWYIIPL